MNEGNADSGKAALRCGEQLQNAAEVLVGIFADQARLTSPACSGRTMTAPAALPRAGQRIWGLPESSLHRPGPLQGVDADDFGIVALQDQAKLGRDFGEFTGNHLLLTGIGFRELAAGRPSTNG